ncbi:MAG: mechanosensitive ion channel protein [Deltaproteobacteria bacterium HGW-Deltaproteobacteria-8]|jgi:small-conductance mechanosensitive channel|nr:MAG: mechanosensitive ion channel protein [Deltaproteobacteria bacterium HGW-Deltaproteobacteria-8]
MTEIVFSGDIAEWAGRIQQWVVQHLTTRAALLQVGLALGLCLAAWAITRILKLDDRKAPPPMGWRADARIAPMLTEFKQCAWAGVSGALLLMADATARYSKMPHKVLSIAASIALAWVAAHVAGTVIKSRLLGRLVAWTIWVMAVLHALDVENQALEFLDEMGFSMGKSHISLLLIIKGAVLFVLLMQAARMLASMTDDRLQKAQDLSPSAQVLFAKGASFGLYALAITITLSTVGVDLTSLTVFSGAVGVGVGFGLQKIFSNLVSGVILLLDKSLKPGDVIEIGGVQGRIAQINARYAAVETLDGKAYLIPNENLIGNEVINLSYNDSRLFLRAEVGVAYAGDPRIAMGLMEQAASKTPRVLTEPPPIARIDSFGDSSVNLSVGFWIEDPEGGTLNVRGNVLLAIWDAFNTGGVSIPFPQREVRLLKDAGE